MARVFGLAAVVAALLVAWLLTTVGLPVPVAVVAASFTLGVVLTRIGHARDDGLSGLWRAVMVAGYLLLTVVAPVTLTIGLLDRGWSVNFWLLFPASIVVLLIASLVVRLLASTGYQLAVRALRGRQRRRLAATRGWQFRPADPAMLAHLRAAQERVSAGPTANEQDRTHGVLTGEANGAGFVVFDYYRPRWLSPPEVATAWLVRLPYALPPFHPRYPNTSLTDGSRWNLADGVAVSTGPDGPRVFLTGDSTMAAMAPDGIQLFGSTGPAGQELPAGRDPGAGSAGAATGELRRDEPPADGLGQAVLTPAVTAHTHQHLPWWWISGPWLAVATATGRGAPVPQLVSTVDAVTRLATLLDWSALARHAVPPTGPE